jgi:hypothetical protein
MREKRQKNMILMETAKTPLSPLEAYFRTCFSPAKTKDVNENRMTR